MDSKHTMIQRLKQAFPNLQDPRLLAAIAAEGHYKTVPAGTLLMDYDHYVHQIPILLTGVIKITTQGPSGDEMLLYYISSGGTCPTALNACLYHDKSQIKAMVEEDAELIAIPTQFVSDWIQQYSNWKDFVMEAYNIRFKELLTTIDAIAFSNLDQRLSKYLAKRQALSKQNSLETTHQAIANDLHTSREAISRLLKKMQTLGYIELKRNQITILQLPQTTNN